MKLNAVFWLYLIEVIMNPINVITFATFCGVLSQPAVMAKEFIEQPAPVIGSRFDTQSPSHEVMERFSHEIKEAKLAVYLLTEKVDEYYKILVESSPDAARGIIAENGTDMSEACEMFLRAFEVEVRGTAEQKDLPDFVASEMMAYWRVVAKARSVVTRLNNYFKSLTEEPKVFDGLADLNHVKELASYTSKKMDSMSFH